MMTIEKEQTKKLSKVYLLDSASMVVFTESGEQIPELQQSLLVEWAERAKKLGYEINGLIVEMQNGRQLKIFEFEHDGEQGINYETLR